MTSAAAGAMGARQVLLDPGVELVAIDLRGTLVRTPRVTALLPELAGQGVPPALARAVQDRFDVQLRGPLQKRGDVLDWTRCAARSMASMLAAERQPPLDVESVVADFHRRYLRESRRLIELAPLRRATDTPGLRCAIVADGPLRREAAVLEACFGTPAWMPPLVSSQCLGVNKLTDEFFARFSQHLGVAPTATVVVGDRWDKDILIPRRAGCRGVLVGPGPAGVASVDSLASLLGILDERSLPCAA